MGYVWSSTGGAVTDTKNTAINVVLAFCMGNDIENILANPIGQPMATASTYFSQTDSVSEMHE